MRYIDGRTGKPVSVGDRVAWPRMVPFDAHGTQMGSPGLVEGYVFRSAIPLMSGARVTVDWFLGGSRTLVLGVQHIGGVDAVVIPD